MKMAKYILLGWKESLCMPFFLKNDNLKKLTKKYTEVAKT